jgi:peptidyl-prolyl cis-trans isomerase D
MLDLIRRNAQSWIVKAIFGIIIVVFVFWGVSSLDGTSPAIMAYVNDEAITIGEFRERYDDRVYTLTQGRGGLTPEMREQVKAMIFNELIMSKMLLQEAKRLQMGATPEELFVVLSQQPDFQDKDGRFDRELYFQRLQEQAMPVGRYESSLAEQLTLSRLQTYIMSTASASPEEARALYAFIGEQRSIDYVLFDSAEFLEDIMPTEEQVMAYYETNKEIFREPKRISVEYLLLTPETLAKNHNVTEEQIKAYYDERSSDYFQQPERVKVSHIMLRIPEDAAQEEKDQVLAEALRIYGEAQTGDFAALARKYSDDASAANGGEIGWVGRGEMIKVFEDAVFALKQNEISRPVLTPFGYHIVKAEARESSRVRSLAEVHDEIRKILSEQAAGNELQNYLGKASDQLLEGMALEAIANELKLDVRKAENFSRDEAISVLGVQDDTLDVLFAVPVNTPVDRPLRVQSGYVLVKVTDVIPEHIQELAAVRDKVTEILRNEEAQQRAMAAAEAALQKMGQDATTLQGIVHTEFFGRQGFIANLGQAPDVVTAAFDLDEKGEWVKKPFPVAQGAVIIRLVDVKFPSDEDWEKAKDMAMQNVLQRKQQDWFMAYADSLQEAARVRLVNLSILGSGS